MWNPGQAHREKKGVDGIFPKKGGKDFSSKKGAKTFPTKMGKSCLIFGKNEGLSLFSTKN